MYLSAILNSLCSLRF